MKDTHFYLPPEKLRRLAAQYAPAEQGGLRLVEAAETSRWVQAPQSYFSGGWGLLSTAADYFRFHQMMLNGGHLDGVRLLSRKSVELMATNQIGDLRLWPMLNGYRFGLGYRILTDMGEAGLPGSLGSYGWGGIFFTYFWVDPKEELIGIFMTQLRPFSHLDVHLKFQVIATTATTD